MTLARSPAIIDGQRIDTAARFAVFNPATGAEIASVARCDVAEINLAVTAARRASDAGWRAADAFDKSTLLRSLAALMHARAKDLAWTESLDTGKPLSQAASDVQVAIRYFTFFASAIETLRGETIPGRQGALAYCVREPFGVTAHITPWNYPLQIAARTLAPALAAGNCCVLKPAEEAPLTSIMLGELAIEAGFPPGVLNVVPGLGAEAGAALSCHPGIDHLAFTGSQEIGALVAREAAANIVPVTLELGGKSPNIVFDDADLQTAVPTIVRAIIQNAGQTCSAGSRLIAQEGIYHQVLDRIATAFATLRMGAGCDDPDIGPLISQNQRTRVEAMVNAAARSAELIYGGSRPTEAAFNSGYFFAPTLLAEVKPDMPIWREEVFGPVLAATSFKSEEEAIALANGTDYGMISAFWTQDVSRVNRMAPALRSAQVYVNSYGAGGGVELPFGGYKKSGYGREKGVEGLIQYMQLKTVLVKY